MAGSSAHVFEKEANLLNDIMEIVWNILYVKILFTFLPQKYNIDYP